jgi:SET domain-containing protein
VSRASLAKELSVSDKPSCYASPRLAGRVCNEKGGRGVFAGERIARGELLVVYAGAIVEAKDLGALAPEVRRLLLQVEESHYLLSQVEGCADWVNHCCEPNAGLRGQVALIAMRDIEVGEEITYDYAMSDGSSYDCFECRCGRDSCRGRVSGDDWMLEELWERYGGYFSPYLQARIDRLSASRAARPVQRRRTRRPGRRVVASTSG